jgi:hypothetical protein
MCRSTHSFEEELVKFHSGKVCAVQNLDASVLVEAQDFLGSNRSQAMNAAQCCRTSGSVSGIISKLDAFQYFLKLLYLREHGTSKVTCRRHHSSLGPEILEVYVLRHN